MNRNMNAISIFSRGTAATATPIGAQASRFGKAVWMALQRFGYRRAAVHLRMLAPQYNITQPAIAKQLLKAAEDCDRYARDGFDESQKAGV